MYGTLRVELHGIARVCCWTRRMRGSEETAQSHNADRRSVRSTVHVKFRSRHHSDPARTRRNNVAQCNNTKE